MRGRVKVAVIVAIALVATTAAILTLRHRSTPRSQALPAQVQQAPAANPAEAVPAPASAASNIEAEPELFSEEEREAIDQDIVHRAQITPASQLEAGLPVEPFEAWLNRVAGSPANIEWEANDCGEQDGSGRQSSIPVCGEATVNFRDGRQFIASVVVGSLAVHDPRATPQWSAKPSLWWTWFSSGGVHNGCSINLAGLPQWLTLPPKQISARCKGKTP